MLICPLGKTPEKTAKPGILKMTKQTANIASFANHMPDVVAIRRHLHRNPEIGLLEFKTSDFIAGQLVEMGYEVTRGLAYTGIVATLRNGDSTRTLGIRADIDALPIHEETGADYASANQGVMHACGHDGHTAMLLGAAKIIAERKNFDGTLHLIFQPHGRKFRRRQNHDRGRAIRTFSLRCGFCPA